MPPLSPTDLHQRKKWLPPSVMWVSCQFKLPFFCYVWFSPCWVFWVSALCRTQWWWTALNQEWPPTVKGLSLRGEKKETMSLCYCVVLSFHICQIVFFPPRVHGPEDSQDAVFQEVKPLLTSLLDGWVLNPKEGQLQDRRASASVQCRFSSPPLQLQRVYHGIRADRQWEDAHHDGLGAPRGAFSHAAGHHPQGSRWTLSVRWKSISSFEC